MAQISIIIPTKDRPLLLLRCLNSLGGQKQFPSAQIIVVDNSLDKSAQNTVLEFTRRCDKKIDYIWEKKIGQSYARNTAISHASSDILAFTDDDCVVDRNWLKVIKNAFDNKDLYIIQGQNKNLDSTIYSLTEYYQIQTSFLSCLYRKNNIWYSQSLDSKNFACRKLIFTQNKLFDTKLGYAHMDYDLGLSLRQRNLDIIYQPQMIVYHQGSKDLKYFLLRNFKAGQASFHFQSKWHEGFHLTKLWLKHLTTIKKGRLYLQRDRKRTNKIATDLKSDLLIGRSIMFRLRFYLLISSGSIMVRLGYFFEKFLFLIKK